MSAGAYHERVRNSSRFLLPTDTHVPREQYIQKWQVDPDCVTASDRERRAMEDMVLRTAVYRLVALHQASRDGEQEWLPDPRLLDPELQARATRGAMHILARRLTRLVCRARGAGWSWRELAGSVIVTGANPSRPITGIAAFESVSGQAPGAAGMRSVTWRCSTCRQHITDQGPYGHPSDYESGHAVECARHQHEIVAYERAARPTIDAALLRAGQPGEEDTSTEDLCRVVRSTRCGCARCYYCDRALVLLRHEHDHFPVPRSAGGDLVVPACLDCHELKDQFGLYGWPHHVLAAAWHGILTCLREHRFPDADDLANLRRTNWWTEQPDSSDEAVAARWHELRPLSRVLYAKARAEKERHKHALPEDTVAIAPTMS